MRRWSVELDPSDFQATYAVAFGTSILAVAGSRARVYSAADGSLQRAAEFGVQLDWACECAGGALVLTRSYGVAPRTLISYLTPDLQLSEGVVYAAGTVVAGVSGDLVDPGPRMSQLPDGGVRLMSSFRQPSGEYRLISHRMDATLVMGPPMLHASGSYTDEDWVPEGGPVIGTQVAYSRYRYATGSDYLLAGVGADPLYQDSITGLATLRSLPELYPLGVPLGTSSQVRYTNTRPCGAGAPLLLAASLNNAPTMSLLGVTRNTARLIATEPTATRSLWYGVDLLADGRTLAVLRGSDPSDGSLERVWLEGWDTGVAPALRLNQRDDAAGISASPRLATRAERNTARSLQHANAPRLPQGGQTYA